jgi:HNH endonuclease
MSLTQEQPKEMFSGKRKTRRELTQERLRELLHYDPDTGVFTWLVSRGRVKAGTIAGSKYKASSPDIIYIQIMIDGCNHTAHRLAFLYMIGAMPPYVDHWDTDGTNNMWGNLRECTLTQNQANRRSQLRHKSTGNIKGWCWNKANCKWQAYIKINGKTIHLGYFDNHEDAAAAYAKAAAEHFGEFARTA